MGMVMCLDTASDESVRRLLSEPELIESWFAGEEGDNEASDEHIQIDLDKAWHAIHYLLSGSAEEGRGPEAFLFAGGAPVGDIDVGYGPARAFLASEIATISRALSAISPEALRARFKHPALAKAGIYPDMWNSNDPADVDYVIEYYHTLVQHLQTAVSKGMGMIVYLT